MKQITEEATVKSEAHYRDKLNLACLRAKGGDEFWNRRFLEALTEFGLTLVPITDKRFTHEFFQPYAAMYPNGSPILAPSHSQAGDPRFFWDDSLVIWEEHKLYHKQKMKLFDVVRQSHRFQISDQHWVMDVLAAQYKASLSGPHIQFAKIFITAEGEQHFQCFVSDQDIEIKADGSADVIVSVIDLKEVLKLRFTDKEPVSATFKFTFYKEVPFTTEIDAKNYRWLIEKATQTGAFRFNSVNGSIEVCDDSTATELDQDITQMRKLEQEECKTN